MRPTTQNSRSVLVGGFVEVPASKTLWLFQDFRASNRASKLGIHRQSSLGLLVISLLLLQGHL